MKKEWYKFIFQQIDPIHIGLFNYGVLSETRIFIPGWTIWGALVNKYGQINGGEDKAYEKGKKLFETITCFYPCFSKEGRNILFPKYKKGEFYLGDYSENKFRLEFTDVYVSTSIISSCLSAKDKSLHEIEIILPKSKNNGNQLYWVGLIGIEKENIKELEIFLENKFELIVGGDSRYGFGKLKLCNEPEISELDEWGFNQKGELEFVKPLRNYLNDIIGNSPGPKIIENVITEFDFSKNIPVVKENKICIVPGSKANNGYYKLRKGIFEIN